MNKIAIITAASRGIGAACARELASRDFKVVLMARSCEVETVAEECGGIAIRGSVTEPCDLQRLVDAATSLNGRIEAVVCNAGHPPGGDLITNPDSLWDEVYQSYLMSVVRLSRLLTPILLQQQSGSFVCITGCDAFEPDLQFPVACAIRPAVAAYAKMYSQRYASSGLRMNCVAPGVTMDCDPGEVRADLKAAIPMQRPAYYREIAKAVAFLLSADASYITGAHLKVDGGLSKSIL